MDFIYWRLIFDRNRSTLDHHYSLSLLIITTLFLSFESFYIVAWCTNDINTSCQQQLIYFAWHGLYLLTFQLVTATLDHHYSLLSWCVDEWCWYQRSTTTYLFYMARTSFYGCFIIVTATLGHHCSLYLLRIVLLLWCEVRMISISAGSNNLLIFIIYHCIACSTFQW